MNMNMKKILLTGSALVAVSFTGIGAAHATELSNPTHVDIIGSDAGGLTEIHGASTVTINSNGVGPGLVLGANATPSVAVSGAGGLVTLNVTTSGAANGVIFADNITTATGSVVINATNDNVTFRGDTSAATTINAGSGSADPTITVTVDTFNAENIIFAGAINAVDATDTVNMVILNSAGAARTIDFTGQIGGGSNATRIDNIQIGAANANNTDVRFVNSVNAQGNITLGAVGGTNTNTLTFGQNGQARGYTGTVIGAESGDTNNIQIVSGSNTSFNSAFGANLDNILVGGAGTTTVNFQGDIAAVSGAFTLGGTLASVINNVTFTASGGNTLTVNPVVAGQHADANNHITIAGGAGETVRMVAGGTNIDTYTINSGTKLQYEAAAINNVSGAGGILTLNRAGDQAVTGDIGATGAGALGTVELAGSGIKTLNGATYAAMTTLGGVTVDAAGSITGNIDFLVGNAILGFRHNAGSTGGNITAAVTGHGRINFAGSAAVDGLVGTASHHVGRINIDGDNTRNVAFNGQTHVDTLAYSSNGVVDMAAGSSGSTIGTLSKSGAGTSTFNNAGTAVTIGAINVTANTLDVNGPATAGDATLASGTTLQFAGATLGAVSGGGGNLTLDGGAAQAVGALGASGGGNALGTVNLEGLGAKTLSGAVYAGTLNLGDIAVTAQNATLSSNVNFKANNVLNLANATTLTGNVTNDVAGQGTINYAGGLNITGSLAQLNTLTVTSPLSVGTSAVAADAMDVGIQSMTVGTTFTTTGTTQLTYRVNTPTTSGKITAGGEATVVAGTKVNMIVDTNVYVAQGQEFVLIDGAESGGHVDTLGAGNLTTTNTALLHFKQKTTDKNNLVVYADRTQMNVAAKDANAASVGAMLDKHGFFADPDVNNLQVRLGQEMTAQGVEDILKTLHPDASGAAVSSVSSVGTTTSTITSGRVDSVRAGDTPSGASSGDGDIADHVWLQAFGASADQGRRDGVAGYDADSYGFIGGIDNQFTDDLLLGIAVTYAQTDADSADANRTDTEMDSYQISVYGDHDLGDNFFLTGQVSYMYSDIDTVRHNVGGIVGNTARANFNADQYSARAEVGRSLDVGSGISITPSGLVNYSYVDVEDYTERGAGGLSLRNVDTDEMQVLEFGVNVKAEANLKDGNGGSLKPNVHAGVRHDVIGDDLATTGFLAGGGAAFKTEGFDAAQTTGNIGTGLKWETAGGFDFSANYDYEYKSDYDAHSGYVRAGYRF